MRWLGWAGFVRSVAGVAVLVVLIGLSACGGTSGTAGSGPGSKDEIVLGHVPAWTTATLVNSVGKVILEEMGYGVELQEAEMGVIYQGLAQGVIDLYLDSWYPSQRENWDAWSDQLERLGVVYDGAYLAWIVPDYLSEVRSIPDLLEHVDLFDADGNGVGEILSYGAGSGASVTSAKVIEAYDLPYEVVDSSSVAMLAEMQARIDRQEPFVGMGWRPHWMFDQWPIRYLEDPKEMFIADTVYVIATKGFAEQQPELAALFAQFAIPMEEFEAMTWEFTMENRDPWEIGQEWVEEHRDRVEGWIQAARGE